MTCVDCGGEVRYPVARGHGPPPTDGLPWCEGCRRGRASLVTQMYRLLGRLSADDLLALRMMAEHLLRENCAGCRAPFVHAHAWPCPKAREPWLVGATAVASSS